MNVLSDIERLERTSFNFANVEEISAILAQLEIQVAVNQAAEIRFGDRVSALRRKFDNKF